MTPLSVVIAARNAQDTIGDQLAARTSQDWPAGGEIIVVDNGSTDRTAAIVRNEIMRAGNTSNVTITLVNRAERPGAAYARNTGVQLSSHDNIAFCDADDVVAANWVDAMTRALGEHCVVGGRLELQALNAHQLVDARGTNGGHGGLPRFDDAFPVVSSCNFGIRRQTFDAIGGFDEQFLRGQDAELSLRLHEAGITAHFAPTAVVHYRLRESLGDTFRQAHGWGRVNDQLRQRLAVRPRLRSSIRSSAWLLAHIHHLADPARRARWVYVAGIRTGLVRQGLKRHLNRVPTNANETPFRSPPPYS